MQKKYGVTFLINGETKRKRTDNIEEAILSVKPPLVHTEMFVTVKVGDNRIERKLNLINARKLFNDSLFREIFINNLMLPQYG